MFHHCDVLIVEKGLHITHTLRIYVNLALKMFSGNEKFSQKSMYTQMHVHILTVNCWFIFAWSKVNIYVKVYGYYAPSDRTL